MPPKPTPLKPPISINSSPQLCKWLSEGLILHENGNLTEAKVFYKKILEIKPDHCETLQLIGTIETQTGNYAKAVEALTNALEIVPNHALTQNNLGVALENLKQFDAAMACYKRAIDLLPDYAEAHFNCGNVLREQQQYHAAIKSYDQAIGLVPNYLMAHYNKALVLYKQGELQSAIASFDKAIAISPNSDLFHNDRGVMFLELKKFNEALSSFNNAIKLNPNYAVAYSNRGNALLNLNNITDAIESYDKAISINPTYAEAYYRRGRAYQEQRNFEAAIDSYEKAITSLNSLARVDPKFSPVYYWRGVAYYHLRKIDAAIESYEQAISVNPNYIEALHDSALAYLLIGDFDKGWKRMEWRREGIDRSTFKDKRYFNEPLWLGNDSLVGKTILLHSEQGLGDTILFSRYAKLVSELGARVILEVQPQLVGLLRKVDGISQIVAKGEILPKFDYQTPLLSLPLAFRTNKNSIPSFTKYAQADPIKTSAWRVRLGEKLKPQVGLVWSGIENDLHDDGRSMQLNKLIPYLTTSVSWISLKNELSEVDKLTLHNNSLILDFADDLNDFSDTGALIECLDLVITVDTSVAHLSSSLGKETWLLLPYTPDWCWQLDRDDSPWYPSIKLYRQPSIGDWTSVLEKVRIDLLQHIS